MRLSKTLFHCFFFFQAEDGIRDGHVTGVQTCALPISPPTPPRPQNPPTPPRTRTPRPPTRPTRPTGRSEERRVGKESRSRRGPEQEKKRKKKRKRERRAGGQRMVSNGDREGNNSDECT